MLIDNMKKVVVVVGTGTDVGKTFIASLLVHKWHADYWKPIQTGLEEDTGDTERVSRFPASISEWKPKLFSPSFELMKPLSPYDAMKFEPSTNIQLSDFELPTATAAKPHRYKQHSSPLKNSQMADVLVVETAGGLFVPITKKLEITTDLIKHLIIENPAIQVTIVLVTSSVLGTLNHTMLSVEHIVNRGLGDYFAGCIVNGPPHITNVETLESLGVNILAVVEQCAEDHHLRSALEKIPPVESLFTI